MSIEQPAYGTERIVLIIPRGAGASFVIRRMVFVEGPPAHFYDEETKDFVTWTGTWALADVLGSFDSRDAATEFMRTRRTS